MAAPPSDRPRRSADAITTCISAGIPSGVVVFTRDDRVCGMRIDGQAHGAPDQADSVHLSAADFPHGPRSLIDAYATKDPPKARRPRATSRRADGLGVFRERNAEIVRLSRVEKMTKADIARRFEITRQEVSRVVQRAIDYEEGVEPRRT